MTVDISPCLLNPKPDVYHVNAFSSVDPQDSSIHWNATTGKYDTQSLRFLLNAAGSADVDGGPLTLAEQTASKMPLSNMNDSFVLTPKANAQIQFTEITYKSYKTLSSIRTTPQRQCKP